MSQLPAWHGHGLGRLSERPICAVTVHLLKLCVGIDHVDHLAERQQYRVAQAHLNGGVAILRHVTRNVPRRADELVSGGSMYWVIRGFVRVRQAVIAVEPTVNEKGQAACALILDPTLVRVASRRHRAFQGWRYLEEDDAPRDISGMPSGVDELPESMADELRELGLI